MVDQCKHIEWVVDAIVKAEDVVGGPVTAMDVLIAYGGPPGIPAWEIDDFIEHELVPLGVVERMAEKRWRLT